MPELKGVKHDNGKQRWDLLPIKPLNQIVKVLTHGLNKYDENNWKKVERKRDRYYAALMRHVMAWRSGQRIDPESNLPHLAHAGCCLLFLMWIDTGD